MSTVVALDIGSSAIAGVELKTARERVTLTKAAVEPLPPGLVHDGEIVRPDELAGEIRRFWRSARFAGKRVRLGVANQRVVVRTIELPALDDERERRAAVEFEAAEQIPIPPDQTVVDSQPVLRFANDAGDRERHVVVAAHRDMVEGLSSTVRQAGLRAGRHRPGGVRDPAGAAAAAVGHRRGLRGHVGRGDLPRRRRGDQHDRLG